MYLLEERYPNSPGHIYLWLFYFVNASHILAPVTWHYRCQKKLNFKYHQREAKKIEEQAQNNNFIELFDDRIETGHNFLLIVLIYTIMQ